MIARVSGTETPDGFVRARTESDNPLPLILGPTNPGRIEALLEWLGVHAAWVQDKITTHGALLLRGFPVQDAPTFEAIARAIAPAVTGGFVGTPGNRLTGTVYPSSEGPTM